MNRKVLLVEPNYKNKYPPMGLMKLATYYRQSGDDVRFFKGDLRDLAADWLLKICLNSFLQSTQIQSGRNINWFSLIIFVRLIHLH